MIYFKVLNNWWPKAIMALAIISCSTKPELSDLEIKGKDKLVYLDGQTFNGTAWSSDGKTLSITCHNGIVDSMVVFHENGLKAIKNTSLYGEGTCYDVYGKPISFEEFIGCYPCLVERVAAFSYELKGL